MAKDFAALHGTANDAIALEQKVFIKEETSRGVLEDSVATDFMYILSGGSVSFIQPIESSPHRSGRHHTGIIKQKTETSWTLPAFFNIDTTLGSAGTGEIDLAVRTLLKSMLGKEDVTGGSPVYTSASDPDITFSIYQNGDQWALQAPGAFCESANMSFAGDGQAQCEYSGMAKTAYLIGIGQSTTDNDTGNTITLQSGEGSRFVVGGKVAIYKATAGVALVSSKSADTATPRTITDVTGDVITVDGAVLADADGSGGAGSEVYLAYWEPDTATAINDPQTGLVGSLVITGLTANCVRSATLNMANNHELINFCYGEEGLAGALFTPGARFTAELTLELNLNNDLVEFINALADFTGEVITLILGDSSGRHMKIDIPKAIFPRPEIPLPDTGTIPISFTGNCYQSALDAADEVTVSFL